MCEAAAVIALAWPEERKGVAVWPPGLPQGYKIRYMLPCLMRWIALAVLSGLACTAVLTGFARLFCRYCINILYTVMTFRLQQGHRVGHSLYLFLFTLMQAAQMPSLSIICRPACMRVADLNACCCTNGFL